MKLYDYMKLREKGAEVTVIDKDYDVEVYFYADKPEDDWNKTMEDLSKLLTITTITNNYVEVDFSGLISLKMDNIKKADLFTSYNIEEIMESLNPIISGNVSEEWMIRFVEALK